MSATEPSASPLDILKSGFANREAVQLGPFLVGADGLLRPVDAGVSAAFSVRWRGRLVRASLEASGTGTDGALSLETALGRIPSTASCGGALALREQVFGLVRTLPRYFPQAWRVRLLPDHRIGVEARVRLNVPVAASDLLAGLTSFLLGFGAYSDLLDETGAGLALSSAEGAGTANTCPG